MQVRVTFVGIIGEYVEQETSESWEFAEGATLADFLAEVGRRYGDRLPDHFWDAEGRCFKPLVDVYLNGEQAREGATPLPVGGEVLVLSAMAGG